MNGIITTRKGTKFIVSTDHGFGDSVVFGWNLHEDTGIGDRHTTQKWNIKSLPGIKHYESFNIDNPPETVSYNPHLY